MAVVLGVMDVAQVNPYLSGHGEHSAPSLTRTLPASGGHPMPGETQDRPLTRWMTSTRPGLHRALGDGGRRLERTEREGSVAGAGTAAACVPCSTALPASGTGGHRRGSSAGRPGAAPTPDSRRRAPPAAASPGRWSGDRSPDAAARRRRTTWNTAGPQWQRAALLARRGTGGESGHLVTLSEAAKSDDALYCTTARKNNASAG